MQVNYHTLDAAQAQVVTMALRVFAKLSAAHWKGDKATTLTDTITRQLEITAESVLAIIDKEQAK